MSRGKCRFITCVILSPLELGLEQELFGLGLQHQGFSFGMLPVAPIRAKEPTSRNPPQAAQVVECHTSNESRA